MISYEQLKKNPLFHGIDESEIRSILACLSPRRRKYEKDETIFSAGEAISEVALILSGNVLIEKEDFWGNRSILAHLEKNDLFGEAFASLSAESDVNAVASAKTDILFLHIGQLLTCCTSACAFHQRLIRNLLAAVAEKNTRLAKKADLLAQRTVRGKLLAYLSSQAQLQGSPSFDIPFSRQQLADYLSVDRSHMTVELGKLEKEGILRFQKNRFQLLQPREK